jgi:serine/threonine protein kinase
MKHTPALIISKTIMRYLKPPVDKEFWKAATCLKHPIPALLYETISYYFEIERMRVALLLKGDELLYKYIIDKKDEQEAFPINGLIQEYEKEWFTSDDNEFYNRVIYEKENKKLREENDQLKLDLEEDKKAEKNLINNDYQRIRLLGSGGFGRVHLVKHRISSASLAIKQLIVQDIAKQADILREIQALAPLNHQNVINYKTSFKVDDELFLVMEYCPGGSLSDKLRDHGNLHEDELVNLFLALTKAFSYLHQKGIVHHDIKPSNLLFTEIGEIKISDFGAINTTIGTVPYYAPELYVSDSHITDPRIDIFALGVTLLECSLGYNPFTNKTREDRLLMLRKSDLPINNLPLWLQDIIFKSINYNIDMRFQTMQEFHEALINKNIPKFLTRNLITREAEAKRLNGFIRGKRWIKANQFIINHSDEPEYETNLNLLINAGNYFLQTH